MPVSHEESLDTCRCACHIYHPLCEIISEEQPKSETCHEIVLEESTTGNKEKNKTQAENISKLQEINTLTKSLREDKRNDKSRQSARKKHAE